MNLAISKLVSSIIQIILFSLVPFIWWLITARKECGFFKWIGLKKTEGEKNKTVFWIIGVSAAFLVLSIAILYFLKGTETATSDFSGLGAAAIPAVLIFPEEILE